MNYLQKTVATIACVLTASACVSNKTTEEKPVNIENKQAIAPSTDKTMWRSLIKNNNLNQWQPKGGKAPYHLEDNTIVGTTIVSKHNSFLTSKEIFSDFIFEVDVNVEAGMNSGVQFRSNSVASYKNGRVHGYQMEIDTSNRKWSGGIFDEARSGWIYNLSRNKKCQDTFKVAKWNTYRIEAIGPNLRTFINGVPCAHLIDQQSASGFIALQVHSDGIKAKGKQVKWRNPRILTENLTKHQTPIDNTHLQFSMLVNELTDYEKQQGWQLLWDGKAIPNKHWHINNRALTNKQATSLTLDIPFDNFEIEMDIDVDDNLDGNLFYLLADNKPTASSLAFKLADDKLNPKAKDTKHSLGAITDKVPPVNASEPNRKAKREKGKWGWNRARVIVQHGKVQHWMNNVKIAELTLTAEQKLAASKLQIQINKGAAKFRNIKLRKVTSNPGDREGHVMKEVVPRELIPQAPILDIDAALKSFHVHPEFEVEVVANEPLIFDPVVAKYDAAGRIWALEMTTYMPNTQADGEMKHESQIVVLSDTNNDGKMDTRQVVVEKILLPRALAFIQGGILWADNEQLYFSEIKQTGETFNVIKTDTVDASYAKGGNIEHKPNGLLYSLDNWYYNAKSAKRYRPYPLDAKLPKEAKEIYRNKYWKMAAARTEYRGQWGLTQDDYGRHYFNYNYTPLLTTSYLPNVAYRNAKHKFSNDITQQKVGTNDVYPVRVTPGINRGYMKGMYDENYRLNQHTAACGPVIYRGNQYPKKYYGIGIAQEPAGNLIKATKITETDGKITGINLFDQQEIIASTDERFRPVDAINAPDGTITVIDFYHGILQHRTFLTSYLSDQIKMRDLERNNHIGRLYRLKHKNSPLPEVTYLENLSAGELVSYLAHDNGWHRDTAKQLLVMKQDTSVIAALKKRAINDNNHLGQINALWTLEGLGVIDLETLKAASNTKHPKVKRSVYRLAELLPASTNNIKPWLTQQVASATTETAPILSLTLAHFNAWSELTKLINTFGTNDFTYAALANKEADFLQHSQTALNESAVTNIQAVLNTELNTKKALTLKGDALLSYGRGKALYNGKAGCFGCHGADGKGNQIIPPLDNSEWVTQSKQRLTGILLHGLTGPISVAGKKFNSPMPMPGLGQNSEFTDQKLADIATFIRNAWNNSSGDVSAADVKKVRQQTQTQAVPYTAKTINDQFKH